MEKATTNDNEEVSREWGFENNENTSNIQTGSGIRAF
jgi:hypothetical protein